MIYELKSSVGLKEYRIIGAAIPTELGSPQTLQATMSRERPLVKLEVLYDPGESSNSGTDRCVRDLCRCYAGGWVYR